MRLAVLLLLLSLQLGATDVPDWVLSSLLWTETKSYYTESGAIHYTDKCRGQHGERSAFQITKSAFNQVKHRGEQFWMIEVDQAFAEIVAVRYLNWLHKSGEDWLTTCERWNAGPGHGSATYRAKIRAFKESIQ